MPNPVLTQHFVVSYDDSFTGGTEPDGPTLAQAVLDYCEYDLARLSVLFLMKLKPIYFPIYIKLVPGSGGATNYDDQFIECSCDSTTEPAMLPALVAAELAEIFMNIQGRGWNSNWSNGEALSKVCAQILYPDRAAQFSTALGWLNSLDPTTNDRFNWVDKPFQGDANPIANGCGTLFLNYLAYQMNQPWLGIIAFGAPQTSTLAETANLLLVTDAWWDFYDRVTTQFPLSSAGSIQLSTANPFPLGPASPPVPSLYIRRTLVDDGTSHSGWVADSPDIILKNDPVDSPQEAFSTSASIQSNKDSAATVITGQTNYVYLRVWNGSADIATNVFATVYWSSPATFVSPNMWTLIGSAYYPAVASGASGVQVSNPGIIWPADQIPGTGHYCFVATVGNASAPAPDPASFNSFDDFVNYIYANNNITGRNFNVVDPSPQPSPGPWDVFVPLKFHIVGAWDRARHFVFETFSDLPEESRFALQVPHWLGRGFTPVHPRLEEFEDPETDPENPRRLRIPLHPHGHHSLGRIELPVGTAAASHMLVHIPPGRHQRSHKVGIRQLYEGREVGRITWLLRPKHEELQR